jgi:hypothetical protein
MFEFPLWSILPKIAEKLRMFFLLGQLKNMKLVNKLAQLVASLETPRRPYWTLEAIVDLLCD